MLLTLKGNPLSTNNIYRKTEYHVYMTEAGKSLKQSYFFQLKNQWKKKPLTGDIVLTVILYFGDRKIRDIDNYNKLLLDSCTGILWEDDKQIQEMHIYKKYDKENPRIEIQI